MTEDERAELRRLHEAATPGPWYMHNIDDENCMNAFVVSVSDVEPDPDELASSDPAVCDGDIVAITLLQTPRVANTKDWKFAENAAFIAAARTAVPALLDEVARLRAEIVRLGYYCAVCHAAPGESCACPGRGV